MQMLSNAVSISLSIFAISASLFVSTVFLRMLFVLIVDMWSDSHD